MRPRQPKNSRASVRPLRTAARPYGAVAIVVAVIVSLAQFVGAQDPSTPTTPSAPPAGVTPAFVPPATGNNAVITVKVGGSRDGLAAVSPQGGVTLQLFDGTAAGPTDPAEGLPDNTCVSDADGDCFWVIPDTQVGQDSQSSGVNMDRQFWIQQIGPPASGTFNNLSLVTTGAGIVTTPYRFRTGPELRANNTYTSTQDFMIGTGTSPSTSGGIWQTSVNNPTVSARCGLRVALVLDLSSSLSAQNLADLKAASTTFVNSLVGTPSAVALFTFATAGPAAGDNNVNRAVPIPVSTLAGAATVNGYIDNLSLPGGPDGGTNWDRGLAQVADAQQGYDVAVVVTDGNPSFFGQPPEGAGGPTRFREVENGIFSANAIKDQGTRVIAFGVGTGLTGSAPNLRAISGPTVNSDYFQTADYPLAGDTLRALALGACEGTVSVVKQVVPFDAPPGTTEGALPAEGWTFSAETATSGVTIDPASGQTESGTGALNFGVTFPGGVTTADVTVTETLQPDFTLQPVGGSNATCFRLDTTPPSVIPSQNTPNGFTVAASPEFPVSCAVFNRASTPQSTVQVDLQWVINGQTYSNTQVPSGFVSELSLNGTVRPIGQVVSGFEEGEAVTIDETSTIQRPLCTLTSRTVTLANGAVPPDGSLPFSATLVGGANTFEVTNVVECNQTLTLNKAVEGGPADPADWTLQAIPSEGGAPGPNGVTNTTESVTGGVLYALAESGGDPNYRQFVEENATLVPGSTGSWQCVEVDETGTAIPGFSDGLNGGVTVPIGTRISCTAINQTAQLSLVKNVTNDDGGTASSADWTLTAAPNGTPPTGVVAQSVEGSLAGADLFVLPGQEYSLTESGVEGYELQSVLCTVGAADPVDVRSIVLGPNDVATCTFLNDDLPETAPPVDPPPTSSTTTTVGPDAAAPSEPPSATPGSGTPLAVTGGDPMGLLGFGLIILGLGICLTELRTRRRA